MLSDNWQIMTDSGQQTCYKYARIVSRLITMSVTEAYYTLIGFPAAKQSGLKAAKTIPLRVGRKP